MLEKLKILILEWVGTITDVSERILELKCRCGLPQGLKGFGPVVSSPIYSTGVGLILYGIDPAEENICAPRQGVRKWLDYLVEAFI